MRRFCFRLIVFFGAQAAIFFGLIWSPDLPRETNYLAATLDKQARLRSTPPPRIILIGSSSFAFGVRSDRLEEAFGRPVINMGLDGSVGLDFVLAEVRSEISSGDCIVLSFEAVLFRGGVKHQKQRQILDFDPSALARVDATVRRGLLDEHGLALVGSWTRRSLGLTFPRLPARRGGSSYSRADFNAWGDYVGHYGLAQHIAAEGLSPEEEAALADDGWGRVKSVSPGLRERLEAFAAHCRDSGALFVFTCPPQPREYLEQHHALVTNAMDLIRSAPGIVILDSPEDHLYETELFFDTKQHLTKAGADLRTSRLIDRLRTALPAWPARRAGSATMPDLR